MDFKKRLIIFIGINLGIVLVIAGAIIFLAFDVVKWSDRIVSIRKEINFKNQSTSFLASLRGDSELVKTYSPAISSVIPSRDELLNFSKDLNSIANQNKVSLTVALGTENREAKEGGESGLGAVSFSMVAEGNFIDLMNFFKAVKTGKYMVKIGSVDLISLQKDVFRATMGGQVFSL
ncbi:hypothetical protein HY227_02710 [Candidatus Wolfebacteria bacterium]|nr:hypothetical protein [Candidatus Wolfebacteria bacterium]